MVDRYLVKVISDNSLSLGGDCVVKYSIISACGAAELGVTIDYGHGDSVKVSAPGASSFPRIDTALSAARIVETARVKAYSLTDDGDCDSDVFPEVGIVVDIY